METSNHSCVMSNPFKNLPEDKKIHVGKHFFIIEDNYPVSPGHLLIISNKEKNNEILSYPMDFFLRRIYNTNAKSNQVCAFLLFLQANVY